MSGDREVNSAMPENNEDIPPYLKSWRESTISKVVEAGLYGGAGVYGIHLFRTRKLQKGYESMKTLHKLRFQIFCLTFTTAIFYLGSCRVLDVGIYHPYKTVQEQFMEEMDWFKDKRAQVFGSIAEKVKKD